MNRNELNKFKNQKIKFFLKNGYKYEGQCLGFESGFLIFVDQKTNLRTMFNLSEVREIEVQDAKSSYN